jgi:hypothetical protein
MCWYISTLASYDDDALCIGYGVLWSSRREHTVGSFLHLRLSGLYLWRSTDAHIPDLESISWHIIDLGSRLQLLAQIYTSHLLLIYFKHYFAFIPQSDIVKSTNND